MNENPQRSYLPEPKCLKPCPAKDCPNYVLYVSCDYCPGHQGLLNRWVNYLNIRFDYERRKF